MDPKKKISAKTRNVGIGREVKNPGRVSITPVAARSSLKIITENVLAISLGSKAAEKKGTISSQVKWLTNTLIPIQISTAATTGSLNAKIRKIASAIAQAL